MQEIITAKDALAAWDANEIVSTIEMGGLGPGYEQAIQLLVFELIRDLADKPLPQTKDEQYSWGDPTVHRCDHLAGGFSGAQVGAAKQVAYRAIRDGWAKMLESIPQDRKICVSRYWPKSPDHLPAETTALPPAPSSAGNHSAGSNL